MDVSFLLNIFRALYERKTINCNVLEIVVDNGDPLTPIPPIPDTPNTKNQFKQTLTKMKDHETIVAGTTMSNA